MLAVLVASAAAGVVALVVPRAASAVAPTVVTNNYAYTGSTVNWTVPAGITQITVTGIGGEGGRGGTDSAGPSPAGGYQGLVTGTMPVTPGQVLTIGVGSGGASGSSGAGPNSSSLVGAAVGGVNPIAGYGGGDGGLPGFQGGSGYGGAGGAASVITTTLAGTTTTVVAGGSGGAGGSGQYAPTQGRVPFSSYSGRTDTTSGAGQTGISIYFVCNNAPPPGCDGGGGGAGGGGVQGGAQGSVQFGSGTSNEWYGYGGYPGQNSTGGISTLTTSYQPYADNSANGSISISYVAGGPSAPTALNGLAGNTTVSLGWTAPDTTGQSPITDYVVQYALASTPTSWTTFDDGSSTATTATVTGLTNGTAYVFQVTGVNSISQGAASTSTPSITPTGPPAAPTINTITAQDGGLSIPFTPGSSGSPITSYQYQINGIGGWISTTSTTSPLLITGLTNGTVYSIALRAISAIGTGTASAPVSATPQAIPGAPSVTSVSTAPGSAAVSFTAGYSGGGTITNYEYQLNGGSWTSAGSTSSPLAITGLTSGTTYTVAIRAVAAGGTSAASTAASFITPASPGAPTVTSVLRGDTSLSINYTAGNPGGSTITGYEYSLDGGSSWLPAHSASPIVVTGLTNGTTYGVRVRALNAVGNGTASATVDATPATTPGAPVILGGTDAGATNQVLASFTAPSDGGTPITSYQYSTDAGTTWRDRDDAGGATSPVAISVLSADGSTTLVDGNTYSVELRAVNAVGIGLASALATGVAGRTPDAPAITSVTPGSTSLQVSFAPGGNGGVVISGYQYRLDSGSWIDTGSLGNTVTVTGLSNGTHYAVQVRARNAVGNGAISAPVSGTPRTTPAQPTISGSVRGNRTLTVAVSDEDDGGSAITDWQYSTDGGVSWQSAGTSTSPLTITALSANGTTAITNGTSYPVAVRAVNAAGTSLSSTITSVGPATTPSAPTVTLTARNQAIQVAYVVPSDGGSTISAIEYSLDGGSTWVDAGTLTSPFTIGGLTNGTSASVRVRADNAVGAGAPSASASATPLTTPDAPTAVAAVSDTAAAQVSWTGPASNGGAAITGYVATAYTTVSGSTTAGTACTTVSLTCAVTGLTNATTYYVSVVAGNAAGSSVASLPRIQVTPLARPSAPTLNSLSSGDSFLTLAFTAGSAGSAAISSYQYQLNGGAWTTAGATSSPLTISGLTNGTSYTVALRAVSSAGVGTASATLTATPYTYPNAPDPLTIVADAQSGQIAVSWLAPPSSGAAITSYTATAFTAATAGTQATTCTTSTLTCTLAGLTNGTTYWVSLQSQNVVGLSVRSDPRIAATPQVLPGTVSSVTAVAGNGSASLSWPAASQGASPITNYLMYYSSGAAYTPFTSSVSTATTGTVTGLTNGTAYTFKVYAVNGSGTGAASAASNSVTPLAPGTVPTVSAATPRAGGFTFTIANYDASTTYTFAGATAGLTGATVTVTGLSAGGSAAVTVSAAKFGFTTTTSAAVTGSALLAGVTPTFANLVKAPTGYSFSIANYDLATSYAVTTTSGTVTQSAATVTVSGLPAAGSASVTVTASKAGATDGVAVESGAALAQGTAPTFDPVTSTAGGYTVAIANYNPALTYTVTTDAGTVNRSGGALTVTALSPGQSATLTVTATDPEVSYRSATVAGSALLVGTVPTLTSPVATPDGYTFTISNYDANVTYTAVSDAGTTTVDAAGVVTLHGVDPGWTGGTTVTATRSGYTTKTATTSGQALNSGTTPTLSAPAATVDGYTFAITNFDANLTYTFAATNGGNATVDATGVVTVTNLAAAASSTTTVTATRDGYTTTSAQLDGAALNTGTVPTFTTPVRTATGYTFSIVNYDSQVSYFFTTTSGSATADSAGHVTVSGIVAGANSSTTVTATRAGYTVTSAATSGAALSSGTTPTLSTPVRTADGYTFSITNFDPAVTYLFTPTDGGSASLDSLGNVTVTGLLPAAATSMSVTATRSGYTDATATASSAALNTGVVPTFSTPVRTADGYLFFITNYSTDYTYQLSASNGASASLGSLGNVTVTGVSAGSSSTTTITASRPGYTDAWASATESALAAGTTPTLSSPVRTASGYSFAITNYSAALSYTVTVSDSASAVIDLLGNVTVSGMAPAASATATVTGHRSGYTDAFASTTGSALAAGTVPTFSTPVRTSDGYTFAITNYASAVTYTAAATSGSVSVDAAGTVTVTGLAAGALSTIVLTASEDGYTTTSASTSASALDAGTAPTLSSPVRTAGGYTFTITNYADWVTYTVTATNQATTLIGSTGNVTVSGLVAGDTSTATVTATRDGYTSTSASTLASALDLGTVPALSTPAATGDGFTLDITNYSTGVSYRISASNGATVVADAGHLTVSGLAAGAASLVTVTAQEPGHLDASAQTSGSAKPAPVPSTPVTGTPSASPTTAPDTSQAPTVSPESPGAGTVTVDGVTVGSTLTPTEAGVVLTSGRLSILVAAMANGKPSGVGLHGRLTVEHRGHLQVSITGFRPGTTATVWGFSTPVLLSQFPITLPQNDLHGFVLPASIEPGNHTLVVTGTRADGKAAMLKVGLVVTGTAAASPVAASSPASATVPSPTASGTAAAPTPSSAAVGSHAAGPASHSMFGWLAFAVAVFAAGACWLLVFWRRRRKDEQPAPR